MLRNHFLKTAASITLIIGFIFAPTVTNAARTQSIPNTFSGSTTSSYSGECLRLNGLGLISTTTCPLTMNESLFYGYLTKQDASVLFLGDSTAVQSLAPRWPQSFYKAWDVPWVGVTAGLGCTSVTAGNVLSGCGFTTGTGESFSQSFQIAPTSTPPGGTFPDSSGVNNSLYTYQDYNSIPGVDLPGNGTSTGVDFITEITNLSGSYLRGDYTKSDTVKFSWKLHKPAGSQHTNGLVQLIRDDGNTVQYNGAQSYAISTTYGTTTYSHNTPNNVPTTFFRADLWEAYTTLTSLQVGGLEMFIPGKTGVSIADLGVGSSNSGQWAHNQMFTSTQIRNTLGTMERPINGLMIQLGTNCGTGECVDTDAGQAAYKAHMNTVIDDWVSDIVASNSSVSATNTPVLLINPWTYGSANGGAESEVWAARRAVALRDIASERSNVSFIDLDGLLKETYGPGYHTTLFSDGVHQSTYGAEQIGQITWAALSGSNKWNPPNWNVTGGNLTATSTNVGIGATSTEPFDSRLLVNLISSDPPSSFIAKFASTTAAGVRTIPFSVSATSSLFGYNGSNYWSNTVGSTGGLTMQGVGTGGSFTLSPTAGQNALINLSTTGDFKVNTSQLYVDTSAGFVGIGTTTPASTLTVKGGIGTDGAIPTPSSCGTNPAITLGSTDTAGEVTQGSVSTGCTITFAAAKTRAPFCAVTDQAGLSFSYTISASAITVTNIGALSSTKMNYVCINNDL